MTASGPGDGDAGAGQVDDVGRRLKDVCRGECADDSGAMKLAETAVDGVLGEELEVLGDLASAGLHDELVVAELGVGEEIVEDDESLGAVLAKKDRASG